MHGYPFGVVYFKCEEKHEMRYKQDTEKKY